MKRDQKICGSKIGVLLAMLAAVAIAGCGESFDGPKLHPLSGRISVNGQPPGDQYRVYLVSTDPAVPEPQLLVQEDGSYQALTGTKGWEGAAAGTYKVVVEAKAGGEAAYQAGGVPQSPLPAELAEYATAESSPKEIEVTASANKIDITIP